MLPYRQTTATMTVKNNHNLPDQSLQLKLTSILPRKMLQNCDRNAENKFCHSECPRTTPQIKT